LYSLTAIGYITTFQELGIEEHGRAVPMSIPFSTVLASAGKTISNTVSESGRTCSSGRSHGLLGRIDYFADSMRRAAAIGGTKQFSLMLPSWSVPDEKVAAW
jgi:hypothetical protein